MHSYTYTGVEPRTPAPPLRGDLVPGQTVESAEPVDHPDLEPANDEVKAVAETVPAEDTPRPRARARAKE